MGGGLSLVKSVMNFRVSQNASNFLTRWRMLASQEMIPQSYHQLLVGTQKLKISTYSTH
jgi:hypothetical protein